MKQHNNECNMECEPPNKRQKCMQNRSNELSDYNCYVCLELPEPIIYMQCQQGHLICGNCYDNPLFSKKCGICNTSMAIRIRCRTAEKVLKEKMINCTSIGCTKILPYGQMKQHVDNDCQFVKIECKYKALGCNWVGIRGDVRNDFHMNISYDELCEKIKELERQKNNYINSDLQMSEIMRNCNIFEMYDLASMWAEFHKSDDAGIVTRYSGNHKTGIRVVIYFKIMEDDPDLECPYGLYMRFDIKCINEQYNAKKLRCMVKMQIPDHFSDYVEEYGVTIEEKFVIGWSGHLTHWNKVAWFELTDVENINELMQKLPTYNCGEIKIFIEISNQ